MALQRSYRAERNVYLCSRPKIEVRKLMCDLGVDPRNQGASDERITVSTTEDTIYAADHDSKRESLKII